MKKFKIKELGTVITGNTPSKKQKEYYESEDICFIKPDMILENNVWDITGSREYISEKARAKARIAKKGDIFVTCIGTIGKIGISQMEECAFNQQINVIQSNDKIYAKYLAYCLLYNRKKLISIANAPVVPIINKTQFEEFEVYIDEDRERQLKVIELLDTIDSIIDLKQKQIKDFDLLIKSKFVEMFGDIKETVLLSYYIKALLAGKSLAGETECANKVLKTGAVTYDYFDETQVKNLPLDYKPQLEHLVKCGDVIISRMNTKELVGAAAYVWNVSENIYLPDRLWKAELKEGISPIFVWQLLIQASTKNSIRKIASGTSGSMKNISKISLLGITVKKVDVEKQYKFATFVQQVDKSKLAVQKSLEELETLKQALMQQYFGRKEEGKNLEDTGIKPIVLEEIKKFAKKNGVKKVILFGSRARGDFERASDIDLAVKGGDITQFTLVVKEETSTLLDFDVVNLEEKLQEKLLDSIRKEGIVIYEEI